MAAFDCQSPHSVELTPYDSSDEGSPSHWAVSLENVLNSYDGLQLFQVWMREESTTNPIEFYYAIRAYKLRFAGTTTTNSTVDKSSIEQNGSNDAKRSAGEGATVWKLAKAIYGMFLKKSEPGAEKPCSELIQNKEALNAVRTCLAGKTQSEWPPAPLFDQCLEDITQYLRIQHSLFVQSQEFLKAVNRFSQDDLDDSSSLASRSPSVASSSHQMIETFVNEAGIIPNIEQNVAAPDEDKDGSVLTNCLPPPPNNLSSAVSTVDNLVTTLSEGSVDTATTSSTVIPPPVPPRRHQPVPVVVQQQQTPAGGYPLRRPKPKQDIPLTAQTLLSTQSARESAMPKRLEALFPPTGLRLPLQNHKTAITPTIQKIYVGAANTSKNESGIASTFSSEASGGLGQQGTNKHKEEHKRVNPATRNIIPRNEHLQQKNLIFQDDHTGEEGRRAFFGKLCEKLRPWEERRKVDDYVLKSMMNIGMKLVDPLAAVSDFVAFEQEHRNYDDEDEDIDTYLNSRLKQQDDSNKPSPGSQQRSPAFYPFSLLSTSVTAAAAVKKHSPKSTSPDRRAQVPLFPAPYSGHGFAPPPPASSSGAGRHRLAYTCYQQQQSMSSCQKPLPPNNYTKRSGMHVSDTSGIGSCTSAQPFQQKQKLLYQKAKDKTAVMTPKQKHKNSVGASPNSSLPRRFGSSYQTTEHWSSQKVMDDKMTIGYYTSKDRTIPYVKKVQRTAITLKDFKHHFALRGENKQLFFKCASDEPGVKCHVMMLVTEDSAILPEFEGKIMAELKMAGESE